jgi:hypothetical protein
MGKSDAPELVEQDCQEIQSLGFTKQLIELLNNKPIIIIKQLHILESNSVKKFI